MNRLTKISVLAATFFTMAFSPLAQVSAAPFQKSSQNYSYGQGTNGDVEQIRHKGRHHYGHSHYKKHRKHRSKRYCHYSPRRGQMVCRPHHRHHHHW